LEFVDVAIRVIVMMCIFVTVRFSRRSSCPLPLASQCGRQFFQRWKRQRKPQEIAVEFGVSVRTVQRLYQEFQEREEDAIEPAYHRCGQDHPHSTAVEILDKAQALRDKHPRWGGELIRLMMQPKDRKKKVPTARTFQRHFRRQGIASAPPGRRPQPAPFRAAKPHEVWQVDASDQMKLKNGRGVSWLRFADEFSGAVLNTKVYEVTNFNTVGLSRLRTHVRRVFARWGRPLRFRVDNGYPFGSYGDFPPELSLWLLGLDIDIFWIPPRRPQNNGVVERSQGVGKNWAEPSTCTSARQLQKRLYQMDEIQRETYPSVQGVSRQQAYPELAHSGREYETTWEKEHWSHEKVLAHLSEYLVSRKVSPSGHVSVYCRNCYVGKHHRGELIYVYLDPDELKWVFTSLEGSELRVLPAPELTSKRIQNLDVAYRRPSRPKPK